MKFYDFTFYEWEKDRVLNCGELDGKEICLIENVNYKKPFAVYCFTGTAATSDGAGNMASEIAQISPRYIRKSVAIKKFNQIASKTA